jgi:hypothetical protein
VTRAIAELGAERIVGTVLNRTEERPVAADDYYAGYNLAQRTNRLAADNNG